MSASLWTDWRSSTRYRLEPRVAARAERDQVRGVICAALTARNDVMRGEIARRAAFAACAVPSDDEIGELAADKGSRAGTTGSASRS